MPVVESSLLSWSTLSVNECHNDHTRCIDRTMLSTIPDALRATREEEDVDAKDVQMQKMELLHG